MSLIAKFYISNKASFILNSKKYLKITGKKSR